MRYGLPYKGSKNAIANWIVDNLPSSDTLCDIFFGGGAVTHAAMLKGKYDRYIINDVDGRMPRLFLDSIHGKYTLENHKEWITREEFNAKKETDGYIAIVWSFGNNGVDYIYGENQVKQKHALHMAVFFNDVSELASIGINVKPSEITDIYERYGYYKREIRKAYGRLEAQHVEAIKNIENMKMPRIELETAERLKTLEKMGDIQNVSRHVALERLQALEGLQALRGLQESDGLQAFEGDYERVDIPAGSVIYCDPPYSNTNCGKYKGFDSERFHEWARKQDNIFISEYQMPDDFILVADIEKTVLADGYSVGRAKERLYTNQKTWDNLPADFRERVSFNTAEQMDIFSFV